jgi:hypothetical protein
MIPGQAVFLDMPITKSTILNIKFTRGDSFPVPGVRQGDSGISIWTTLKLG